VKVWPQPFDFNPNATSLLSMLTRLYVRTKTLPLTYWLLGDKLAIHHHPASTLTSPLKSIHVYRWKER